MIDGLVGAGVITSRDDIAQVVLLLATTGKVDGLTVHIAMA